MKFLESLQRAGTSRYILFNGKKSHYVIRGASAILRNGNPKEWHNLNLWWPNGEQHKMDCWKVGDIIKR